MRLTDERIHRLRKIPGPVRRWLIRTERNPRAERLRARLIVLAYLPFAVTAALIGVYTSTVLLDLITSVVAVGLVYAFLLGRRARGARRSPIRAHVPHFACAATLFAFALVLTDVHGSTYARAARTFAATEHATEAQVSRLLRRGRAKVKDIKLVNRDLSKINSELRDELHRPPSVGVLKGLLAKTQELTKRSRTDETTGEQAALRAAKLAVLNSVRHPPSEALLPSWFSHLGEFFRLAAEILFGLAVALWLDLRHQNEPQALGLLRQNLLATWLGLVAAIIGTLPTLPRPLIAVLLGLVAAGLVSALATLAVRATLVFAAPDSA